MSGRHSRKRGLPKPKTTTVILVVMLIHIDGMMAYAWKSMELFGSWPSDSMVYMIVYTFCIELGSLLAIYMKKQGLDVKRAMGDTLEKLGIYSGGPLTDLADETEAETQDEGEEHG